jgi:hypothetical protein
MLNNNVDNNIILISLEGYRALEDLKRELQRGGQVIRTVKNAG